MICLCTKSKVAINVSERHKKRKHMHTTKICHIVNQIELRFHIVWKISNGINKYFMQLKNYNISMSRFAEKC